MNEEFGGEKGTLAIMIGSHIFVGILPYLLNMEYEMPTLNSIMTYILFILFQFLLAHIMPGVIVRGLSITRMRKNNNDESRLLYLCNAYSSWLTTLFFIGWYHLFFDLGLIIRHFSQYLFTAMLFGDIFSIYFYFGGLCEEEFKHFEFSFYDFFMGTQLHPRFNINDQDLTTKENLQELPLQSIPLKFNLNEINVDIKMFAEVRISWNLLFIMVSSCCIAQIQDLGMLTKELFLVWLGVLLYTNACAKGEEMIPQTWDITTEKFGWMLCWWNVCGVPLVYSIHAIYIWKNNPHINDILFLGIFSLLIGGYYVFDTANSQKNRFKMFLRDEYFPRNTFPQFEYGFLPKPKVFETSRPSLNGEKRLLLIDGWWKYARKPHYTADFAIQLSYALCCGFSSFIPFIHTTFFFTMLLHRSWRDHQFCQRKYGKKDWGEYCEKVPFIFIPNVF